MRIMKPENINGKAFTLAEVLITLGIIGVVAALTLPAIIQKNNKKVLKLLLKSHMPIFIMHIIKHV